MMRWTAAALAALAWHCSAAAGCFAAPAGGEGFAPSRTIFEAVQRYEAARAKVEAELGADVAAGFHGRLFDDLELQQTPPPEHYAPSDWAETVASVTKLDMEAVDQLVSGTPAPLRAVPGLHEVLVPSRVDKTWQLVAVYVPPSAKAQRAPLAVGTDVYDLLGAVQGAFAVDRGRTYLAGYSMGGFSVFKIGPRGGYRWASVLCISGAILNSGVRPVSIAWHDMRLYVVTGAHDASIPTAYGEQTAGYLAGLGLPVSFYEEPAGTHALRTLVPSLERAWDDMHAGVTRPESVPIARSGFSLPAGAAPGTLKP
jgi:hypothetical protein